MERKGRDQAATAEDHDDHGTLADADRAAGFVELLRWAADVHDAMAADVKNSENRLAIVRYWQARHEHSALREYAEKNGITCADPIKDWNLGWVWSKRQPYEEVVVHAESDFRTARKRHEAFRQALLRVEQGNSDLFTLFGAYTGVPAKQRRELTRDAIALERGGIRNRIASFKTDKDVIEQRDRWIFYAVGDVKKSLSSPDDQAALDSAARSVFWAQQHVSELWEGRTVAAQIERWEEHGNTDLDRLHAEAQGKVRGRLEALVAPAMAGRARAKAEKRNRSHSTHSRAMGIVAQLCGVSARTVEDAYSKRKRLDLQGIFASRR